VSRVAERWVLPQMTLRSPSCGGTCVNCALQVEGVRPTCAIPLLDRERLLWLCQVHTLMLAVGWVLPVGSVPPGCFYRLGHWWSRSTPETHLSTCTTLRLHRFGANRPCRLAPACAASSGYAPRACRCPRSTAYGPAPSIGVPGSQKMIDSARVVMGRTAILLPLCLVPASPEHRPPVPDVLTALSICSSLLSVKPTAKACH